VKFSIPRPVQALLLIGPLALYAAATIYGVTEAHSSTDTYIGLAGGRSILESADGFPIEDTFSYTVPEGRWWFNQNWLTHVWQYWLYDRLGPDALVWGTWLMSATIFLLCLFAVWFRTGNLLASILAAAVVGFGCRDFISPRPATTGYFMVSAFWMLLCALEGQDVRKRWWPIVFMLPLLVLWSNAHGSFVFGYVILIVYLAYWIIRWLWRDWLFREARPPWWLDAVLPIGVGLVCWMVCSRIVPARLMQAPTEIRVRYYTFITIGALLLTTVLYVAFVRDRRRAPVISTSQMNALAGVLVAAFVITVALGPFGLANFFHVRDVAESDVWRTVSEWLPPYFRDGYFPTTRRFWWIFGVGAAGAAAAGIVLIVSRAAQAGAAVVPVGLSAFDVLSVAIGLMLALFARRFAPMFYILGAPVVTLWLLRCHAGLPRQGQSALRYVSLAAAWVLAVVLGVHTYQTVERELVTRFKGKPQMGLLERVTRYDATPHKAILYLRNNDLRANVLAEWTQAGPVMFFAPGCRVFMDGRAQQVYDVDHYMRYQMLLSRRPTAPNVIRRLLRESNTEVVLIRRVRSGVGKSLWTALEGKQSEWIAAVRGPGWAIFIRLDSPAFRKICRRLQDGTEWRPDDTLALYTRGVLWRMCHPPDYGRMVADLREATQRNLSLGLVAWPQITQGYLRLGQLAQAQHYLQSQAARLQQNNPNLTDAERTRLAEVLQRCIQRLRTPSGPRTPEEPSGNP